MKHLRKLMAAFLTVILLVQLVAGAIPTLAITSTAQLTDHSFHGEGLWLTEIYPNDTNRSKATDTRAADGQITVTTFDTEGDMMEFVEVISTHDEDFKLNDVYEIYSNAHKLPITTMDGSSDITVTKGQPIVIWNARTDLVANEGVTLPTEAQIRKDLRIPDNALLLKSAHGGGWDNVATFTIKLKSTGATFCTYKPTADVDVKDGLSCELKMPFWKSETTMELYQGMNLPSPGYVYHDQVRGYIKSIVPEDYTGKVSITEVRPNDVNRKSSYGTESDYMECLEITNSSDQTITLNSEYQLVYTYQEAKRKPLTVNKYSSSATNHVGASTGCTIAAGGTAVIWIYRYASLNSKSTSFPTLTAFRNAYGIDSSIPVYISTTQDSLNNTMRGLELFTVDASGNPDEKVSSVFYYGDADVPDNTSATYKIRHDGPGMALYAGAVTSTPGTVEAAQTEYIKDTGRGIELRLHDGVTIPEYIMQGEDLRINFYYEYDSALKRLDTSVYYRFDGTGDWYRQTEGGMRVPNMYESVLAANELFDHKYVELYITSTNPYRTTAKGIFRVNIKSLNEVEGIRANISEGQEVRGKISITANDGGSNSSTAIYIDGTKQTTTPMMEGGAYLTFYADGRDAGFNNALTTNKNALITMISKWQYAIPNAQTHFIDNSYFTYSSGNYKVTLRLWAGTMGTIVDEYITPSANREDYKVSQIKLKLANGNSYLPTSIGPSSYNGVDTSAKTNLSTAYDAIHCIGDSNKWCPYLDMSFTVPSSAVNAVGVTVDTTKLSNGEHTLKVTNGTYTQTVKFIVDNTAPTVNLGVSSGATLTGNITLNPQVTEANSIQKIVTTLDGLIINTPYETTARALGAGSHTLQTIAEDAAGNTTTKTATFTVKDVSMTLSGSASGNVTHSTAQLQVSAQTGSATEATFYEARKIETEAISTIVSDGILPYIQYVINVGPVDNNDEIMVSWNGSASGTDSTHASTLFVRNIRSGAWDKIATADSNGSVENAVFTAYEHVENGNATVIVQCTADSALPDLDTTTDGVKGNNANWDGTGRPEDYDFAFAWLSDPQIYVQRYDYHYDNMTKWLAENAEEWKIKYMMLTGDIVDDWDHEYQWINGDRAIKYIEEAGIPYGVLAGNHDVAATLEDNSYYWKYYGEDRFKDQPTYGESYQNNLGHYDLISQNGQDFVIVYMSWNIYQEEIDWMNEVLAKYADRKAILCFHAYTHTASSVDGLLDYYGVMIRDKVVKKNKNVFAVLNGHYFGSTYQTVRFDDNGDGKLDRTVYQICTDYQDGWHGGAEYMKFLYFDLDNDQVYVNSYSSYYDDFNLYDTAVHDLTAKAKAASNGVVNAMDVDILKMSVDFDTTKQTILADSFSAYLATNEPLGTAQVINGTATVEVTGLEAEQTHYWYADLNNEETGYLRSGVYEFTTDRVSTYAVSFVDEDGTVLQSSQVEVGKMPTAPADPIKATDFVYNYTFAGWSPAITEVTCDVTYTATYTAEKIVYSAGAVEPHLERVTSEDQLEEGVPYVISDYNDNWLHYALTTQPGTKTANSKTHKGFWLEGTPSIYVTDLWYIRDGYLVYGSADSDQYLHIYYDSANQGVVELGSFDADKVAKVTLRSNDDFAVHSNSAYLNRHGGLASDYLATAYSSAASSYWHLDRLASDQIATMNLNSCVSTVPAGATAQLTPTVMVDGIAAGAYVIDWSTSNSSIAAVSADGVLTAKSCGTVTVTATLTAVSGHDLLVPVTQTYSVTVEHSYREMVIDPTCTTGGYTTYRCVTCGDTYQGNAVEATGHSYVPVVTAPTCTAQGYTTYTCFNCGDSYIADYVAALGHSYKTVTVDATCTQAGSTTKTCSNCGDKQTTTIPATGHKHTSKVTAPTCTAEGYTTYTCACGDSYVADKVAALGHSYVDGICGVCGEADPDYVKPVVKPTLKLKAPALEFKDMIKVIAFFTAENLDDVVEMGMITYTSKVAVVDISTAAHVIPGAILDESTGRYFASSQGIHAKYLGDTVYLSCYAKLSDGSYVYTSLASYSALTYAKNQLDKSTDVKLKQLCAAMLNYGAAAQNYFGYNTDVLANSTLTAEQIALPEAYTSDMVGTVPAAPKDKQGAFASNKGFGTRKPAVSFEGAFSINYFFTPSYTPVDGITLYYWTEADFNAADVLTVENASGAIAMKDEGTQFRGDVEGIAAKDLTKAVYVAAVYSDGTTTWTSGVLGYSIGAYCSSQATGTGTMAELAKATAVYGYHAKAYFG